MRKLITLAALMATSAGAQTSAPPVQIATPNIHVQAFRDAIVQREVEAQAANMAMMQACQAAIAASATDPTVTLPVGCAPPKP